MNNIVKYIRNRSSPVASNASDNTDQQLPQYVPLENSSVSFSVQQDTSLTSNNDWSTPHATNRSQLNYRTLIRHMSESNELETTGIDSDTSKSR